MASDRVSNESSEVDHLFSFKRYFINNLDTYHGQAVLAEVSKILEKNKEEAARIEKESSLKSIMAAEDEPLPPSPPPPELPWEIIGTVSDPKIKKLDNVARIIPKENCLSTVLTCGTVIWDVSYDREELRIALEYMKLLKQLLDKTVANPTTPVDDDGGAGESKKRYLILISTVMTWASTRPLDPESPDMPFIETDFRKRKPHPNYKLHYDCENEVIGIARNYKAQIGATVVAAGLTYGGKEDALFYWFQKAWECERFLPILGRGNNVIPLINVFDLAKVIYNLVTDFPKKLYILAVEQNLTKQKEIVKPLGRIVGSGMFKCIPPEDAFLIPEIDQRIYDLMTLNLNMEPTFLPETLNMDSDWTFAENVPALMKQFKKERRLRAFKIVVYGPPLVGKTTLSKMIAENYGLMFVSPETIVQDTIDDLEVRVNHFDSGGELLALGIPLGEDEEPIVDDDDTGEEEGAIEAAKTTLALLRSGRPIAEEEIILYMRQKLLSHEATNKGWVLDGFPTSLIQCTTLFDKGEEEDELEEEEEKEEEKFEEDLDLYNNVLKKMLPDLVVSLEATDDFICDKAMKQPECESRLDEEVMLKRLSDFRAGDTRDLTPLNFFDELDIHPLVLQVNNHQDYAMKDTYRDVALRMGRPCQAGDTRDLTPLNFFDELDIHPLVLQVNNHQDYAMKDTYRDVALRMGRPCHDFRALTPLNFFDELDIHPLVLQVNNHQDYAMKDTYRDVALRMGRPCQDFSDTRDLTPLNFFDELNIHPLVLQVNNHQDYAMKDTYRDVALRMGRPCQYGKLQG
ncbi:adenylate kinase 7 [Phthorimaea operculella]|nr:adenylate kinase 7 [Phthorimaea operculella]